MPLLRLVSLALLFATLPSLAASAQNSLRVRVVDADSNAPLPGANVAIAGTSIGGAADPTGLATLSDIPDGAQAVLISFIGYEQLRLDLVFPLAAPPTDDILVVALKHAELEIEGTTVTATRASRTIADTPTRVEFIAGEEIEEKVSMDPSGISMLLNESPGIVVQQTSAVSASASFRIQGLDGRYTQLLRDAFPLYGGLGGGLSLLQIPPLDLAQVEIIKGPASTLYGGDAIAGLVNLVSKKPTTDRERSLLLNATSAGGFDAGAYFAGRDDRFGYTVLATGNLQRAYDVEPDNFTNLPATRRATFAPTLYRYGSGTLLFRVSGTIEEREGGDVATVRDDNPGFSERNVSKRLTAALGYERPLGDTRKVSVRSSGSVFGRAVEVPGFRFAGRQVTSYTEASALSPFGPIDRHEVVVGVDLRTDRFDQQEGEAVPLDYNYGSVGAFVQDTWDPSPTFAIESGIRIEAHNTFGVFALPRAALLVRPGGGFTARIGGGFGYKAPTPFLEESESRSYRGVSPVADDADAERSIGGNIDVNYRAIVGPLVVTVNQAVYTTRLSDPLLPIDSGATLALANSAGSVQARGSETTARISLDDFTLFLGYVFLQAERDSGGQTIRMPLTARHRTYTVLVWEQHGRGRIGLEAYYTGPQLLTDGEMSPGYLIAGVMAQRRFGPVRVFANLENILDARQSRTSPLVMGPRESPTFPPVWGPTDGFVANAGVIVEF